MKVRAVEAIPFRLPLRGALSWGAHGHLEAAEHVLVRVHLEGGIVGRAEAPPRPTIYGETVASVRGILAYLEPRLKGTDVADEAACARVLGGVPGNNTARGALDMALWDARAQAAGGTLFGLLAGPRRRIRASYILGIAPRADTLEEARRVVEAGVRVLKVKVGRDHARDLRLIADLEREFAGAGVELYADSNETLTPQAAPDALAAMRDAGLRYVEEPLPVSLIRERAALRAQEILPIVADDSCFTLPDLARELDFDTFNILNIKTARTGFTESLAMLALAAAAGKGVMVGSQASSGLGTLHAALIASQAGVDSPCELSFPLKLRADLLDVVPPLHAGELWLDEWRDVQLDPDKLRRFRT